MTSQALEQMLSSVSGMGQTGRAYRTLDVYTGGISHMYSGPMPPPIGGFNDIGATGSGFQKGSQGNIRLNLGYGLQERYDFSKHDGTVHINYDLIGAKKRFTEEALGDAHKIDLSHLFNDQQ
jgi:hypothetical protein